MAGLADILENFRNYTGRLDWQRGKDIERMAGGDPDKAAVLEQLMSLGEGGGHSVGGLAGMVGKGGKSLYSVKPLKREAADLPEKYGASWGPEIEPSTGEEYALIDLLTVPKDQRGQGLGRLALRQAVAEIQDKHPGLPVRLAAYPVENNTDLQRLVRFYEHEGFDIEDTSGDSVIMRHDNLRRPVEAYTRPRKGWYELVDEE